ncbi:CNVH-domain-containing protein [Mycena sanguinolenta]|uniref:CNVH-domain-containing protein n=1 Tax=Mycena sanguinolenta TaxID=230812 RepID=A0A8H7D6F3_9AGAR|nr:CNVH-domain-containing protein [Mycena sanguinolenta]
MAFTTDSRNIRIIGSRLAADVRVPNGNVWNPFELDLNPFLENRNGHFDTLAPFGNFFPSSQNLRIDQHGLLTAELRTAAGAWNVRSIDLNVFVGVSAGVLLFRRLQRNVIPIMILSVVSLMFVCSQQGIDTSATTVSLNGSVFSAFLMGSDGLMRYQEIDLNNHYANINGHFRSNPGDRNFFQTARNVHLGEAGQSFILMAELRVGTGWRNAQVNLAEDMVNNYSRLLFIGRFTSPPTFWQRFLEVFEGVPFVGFVVAGIYALMGDTESARRAVSLSANSTIVMTGAVIGGLLGGPWGAAIGAAITTPIGIFVETQLSPTQQTATIERYIFETIRNTIAAGTGGALTAWLTRTARPVMVSMFSEVNRGFGGHISSAVISGMGSAVETSLRRIFDAIQTGVFPSEWREVDAMVAGLVMGRKIQSFKLNMLQPLDDYKPSPDLYEAGMYKAITLEGSPEEYEDPVEEAERKKLE